MAEMNAIVALQKAERLVSTIARAFYTDNTILVVDTLIREKYIKDKDEDLGSRLNLQPKQVRSALAELLAEGFAAKEMMSDEIYSGRSSNYWYIDLRHAVNVILLRVFEMKEILSQRQEAKAAHQTYVCPRCHEKFEVMDIYKLSNGDRSFCCSHCCPHDNHAGCKKGSGYTLEDFHDKRGLDSVTALIEQLNEQLGKSKDPTVPRESIFELVHSLRDTVVPSNLPSQLRQRGMGGQQRGDLSSSHARFKDDFHHRGRAAEKAAAERSGGGRNNSRSVQVLYTKNWRGEEVVVEIEQSEGEEDDEDWSEAALLPSRAALKRKAADAAAKEEQAAKRAKKILPTFLKGSIISGKPGEGDDDLDRDDSEAGDDLSDESTPNGSGKGSAAAAAEAAAAAATAHARRLGVAAVTNVEERNERKRRLLPWTERMKQVWQQQQLDMLGEEGAGSSNDEGGGAWWENEEGEVSSNGAGSGGIGGGAVGRDKGSKRVVGDFRAMVPCPGGMRFRVGTRILPVESLTYDDAAKMSAEEYTRFYNFIVGERF